MNKSPLQCVSLLSSRKKLLLFLPLLLLSAVSVRRQWSATQDALLINISNKAHSFLTAAAVIPAGSPPLEFSPGLDALVQSRCERFSRKSNSKSPSSNSNIHQTEGHSSTDGGGTLALAHIQKSGGNSLEDLVIQQANRSGKTVRGTRFCLDLCSRSKVARAKEKCIINGKNKIGNSWKAFLPKDNNNSTASNECVRSLVKDANILVSHQDFSYVEGDIRWKSENITNSASKPDWITLIRNPSDKIEFAYKWEQQRGRLKGINRMDKISFQTNFNKSIHKTGSINTALRMLAPLDVYKLLIEDKPHVIFDRLDNNNLAFDKLEPEIQMDVLEKVAMNIADRFSTVGVLDRVDKSLEVLRCRHPWIDATTLPRSNPSQMNFSHKLVQNDTLIREVAMADDYLYTFANRLLSIDVECCRRSR